jgi:hypothetical protein
MVPPPGVDNYRQCSSMDRTQVSGRTAYMRWTSRSKRASDRSKLRPSRRSRGDHGSPKDLFVARPILAWILIIQTAAPKTCPSKSRGLFAALIELLSIRPQGIPTFFRRLIR